MKKGSVCFVLFRFYPDLVQLVVDFHQFFDVVFDMEPCNPETSKCLRTIAPCKPIIVNNSVD